TPLSRGAGPPPTPTTPTHAWPPPPAGQPETLTATVTSPGGTPTGTVTFFDGNTAISSGTLNAAGQVTVTVALGAGNHVLTAVYRGDNTFDPSTSAPVNQTVTSAAATAIALSASTNPVRTGAPVTFTATVTAAAPGAGTP